MKESKIVLITGGTGLVGRALVPILKEAGYEVRILTQQAKKADQKTYFYWDWKSQTMDKHALEEVYALIHLAGKNISEGFWTSKNKQEILDSRVKSLAFLKDQFQHQNTSPKVIISASGTGYYGINSKHTPCSEEDLPGDDFLAQTCVAWEHAAHDCAESNARLVIFRTGVVLSKHGGMLPILTRLTNYYLAQIIGKGTQIIPWIHIEDIARLYLEALENESYTGIYNAVAGNTSQKEFMQCLSQQLQKPIILPALPKFLIRMILGEKSVLITKGAAIDSKKLTNSGFRFKYTSIENLNIPNFT